VRYGQRYGYLRPGGKASIALPSLSAGATYAWVGDGLVANSAGVGHGPNNMMEQLHWMMNGRIQPTAYPNLARSGSRMKTSNAGASQYAWVYPYATDAAAAQTPDVFFIGSMGHNDGVLSTDPGSNTASGSTTSTVLQDWYDCIAYAYSKFTAYVGSSRNKLFVVIGTVPSAITGETTVDSGQSLDRRTRVWNAQKAYANGLAATDNRVLFVDISSLIPPTSYSNDSGSNYTHIDERGGYAYAVLIKAAIDAYIEAKTYDQIMDMIDAQTYPLMGSANLDSDEALAGTGGTRQATVTFSDASGTSRQPTANDTVSINGVTITFVASGATGNQVNIGASANATATNLNTFVNSNLASLGLSATSVSNNILTLSASGATVPAMSATGTTPPQVGQFLSGSIATSKIVLNTSGASGMSVAQVSTSGGRTKTVITLGGTTGQAGRIQISDKSNLTLTATPGAYFATGAIFRASAGFHNFGSDLNGSNYSLWAGGGSILADHGSLIGAATAYGIDGLVQAIPQPVFSSSTTFSSKRNWAIFWRASTALSGTIEQERDYAYLISERTRHGPTYLGDVKDANNSLLVGSNQRLRPTGTISQAAGGTIRVEPGLWTPRGLTEADFAARRIYKGTTSDTGVGTGTLLATLTGSNWTSTLGAGAVTTGDRIYVEVDANNGIGGTVTARSSTTVTAT
jgi:hypothetical protein